MAPRCALWQRQRSNPDHVTPTRTPQTRLISHQPLLSTIHRHRHRHQSLPSSLPSPSSSKAGTAVPQSPVPAIRTAHHHWLMPQKRATLSCHLIVHSESCVLMDYITGYSNNWLCPVRSLLFLTLGCPFSCIFPYFT